MIGKWLLIAFTYFVTLFQNCQSSGALSWQPLQQPQNGNYSEPTFYYRSIENTTAIYEDDTDVDFRGRNCNIKKMCKEINQCGLKVPRKESRQNRIVGGVTTWPYEYPWVVAIKYHNASRGFCGGSLISNKHVLTAGHCLKRKPVKRLRVVLANHLTYEKDEHEISVRIRKVVIHPRYERNRFDIAIIVLKESVAFSNYIRPICLPRKSSISYSRKTAVIVGWGKTSTDKPGFPKKLQKVVVPVWSHQKCQASGYNWEIDKHMLCAGYEKGQKDACVGDSGGPMMIRDRASKRYVLIGITSFGKGCAEPDFPGVYTKVTTFLSWIRQNTRDGCFCQNPSPLTFL